MQLSIMEFFQSIASPFLDTLMNLLTMLGEETIFIIVVAYFIWNYSKKKGFAIFSALAFVDIAMGVIKALVKAPRPFQVIEEIKGKRVQTATGYSFPSGHTTGAASFYYSLSYTFKKRIISILSALAIALVAISRMYLGVHWPLDVFAGLALGIGGTALLYPIFDKIYDNKATLISFTMIVGVISSLLAFILVFTIEGGISDPIGYTDVVKLLSLLGGGYIGFSLAEKSLDYKTDGTIVKKIGRFIIGLIILIAIQGLKAVLPDHMIVGFIHYFAIG
ncbi:MAG: phosphatase PAP2 family protein, partial [Spirochaetia bacterium]|nr:phosphatase PAP2 family protein [Spirochaetia bacterium]